MAIDQDDANLYAALRANFGADRDIAIETADTDPPESTTGRSRVDSTPSGGGGGSLTPPGGALYYTWGDIERASARIANLLESLELAPDSRVAVQVDKSVENLLLYLAVLRAGYVYLPLNSAYQAAELEYFIGNAEPAVVVCADRHFDAISRIAFAAGTSHVFTLDDNRTGSLLARAAQHADTHDVVPRKADDLAAILYTSGTTGRSKGAMLTHGNLLSNAVTLKDFWGWTEGDVLIHALPIFHVHGLFVAIHGALLNGSRMIWFGRFDPKAVIARMADASVFMGVPTLYVRLLAEPTLTQEACARMRVFIAGSAPLLPETFHEWQARTGFTIVERYGMSETVMLTSNAYRLKDGLRTAGTVGKALPGVGVRITRDDGTAADPDEIGGIQVRGPNVFEGYWRMPEKTKEEFTLDGWFKTGDVGKMDPQGVLTIVGRSKDLVITGGYNVYPAEIEGYLNEMAGVAESAVIGVPHPDFGEAVVAMVVPRAGSTAPLDTEAMIAALKSRIANFKVPKRVFVVDELPRNTMGKVQKNVLRETRRGLFAEASP